MTTSLDHERPRVHLGDCDGRRWRPAHAVSPAGLHINFQDDGPHAAEAPQNVLEGSAPVTGQLDFDPAPTVQPSRRSTG